MTDSQLYKVFLDTPSETFLFSFRQAPNLRPTVGDSITQPLSFENFRVMRDEFGKGSLVRVTDSGLIRVTDSGEIRVTDGISADKVTHNYFVLPANNPNRISTWTTSRFGNDQTLKQLFR